MKKKYTKEQLAFYFQKLMHQLGRMPTEEDMEHVHDMPAASTYVERFGSWEKVKQQFGDANINRKKCKNCGTDIPFKKKTKEFCSGGCAKQYAVREKQKKIAPKSCLMCKKQFFAHEVKNFKKQKICNDKECKEKFELFLFVKKQSKMTKTLKVKLFKLKGNKCQYCDFHHFLFLYTKGRNSDQKVLNQIKKKNFDYFLVCPNHKAMLERKML